MDLEFVLYAIAFLILGCLTVYAFIDLKRHYQLEAEYEATLPTLEEAQQQIQVKYPDQAEDFKLVKKSIDTIYGFWGPPVHWYGDFLESKTLGVCIRIKAIDSSES